MDSLQHPTQKSATFPDSMPINRSKTFPVLFLGQLLQHAGLISSDQIDNTLNIQKQQPQQRFGEILVQQGWLKRETVEFFAQQLPELALADEKFPLGHYFRTAALLDDYQLSELLQHQPPTDWHLAELAVKKGWLKQDTVSFIVSYLDAKPTGMVTENVHRSVGSLLKRWLDFIGACVGLAITGILFVPIAIAIFLNDPGPIFYSQTRIGLKGRPFRIWKFRSMVTNADRLKHLVENQAKGHIFKNENDPRITSIGRFLRATSLDEFPQFWNVLKGEMSLVGTRPPTIDEVMRYESHHWQRLQVKPGITGEWQANGRATVKNFEDIVAMDVAYQHKWSIWYDLLLIFKTVIAVFNKKGAY